MLPETRLNKGDQNLKSHPVLGITKTRRAENLHASKALE
jgi:hypothetical protein